MRAIRAAVPRPSSAPHDALPSGAHVVAVSCVRLLEGRWVASVVVEIVFFVVTDVVVARSHRAMAVPDSLLP